MDKDQAAQQPKLKVLDIQIKNVTNGYTIRIVGERKRNTFTTTETVELIAVTLDELKGHLDQYLGV